MNDFNHHFVIYLYIILFQIRYVNGNIPACTSYFITVITFTRNNNSVQLKLKIISVFDLEKLPLHQLLVEFFSHQSTQPDYGKITWIKSIQMEIDIIYFRKIYLYF